MVAPLSDVTVGHPPDTAIRYGPPATTTSSSAYFGFATNEATACNDGADNDSIARLLVISPQTARTHIQNILTKLSVHSRLEAAAFVTQNAIMSDLVMADG